MTKVLFADQVAGLESTAVQPGWMATVLAPTDSAIKSFLANKGEQRFLRACIMCAHSMNVRR